MAGPSAEEREPLRRRTLLGGAAVAGLFSGLALMSLTGLLVAV